MMELGLSRESFMDFKPKKPKEKYEPKTTKDNRPKIKGSIFKRPIPVPRPGGRR